MLAVDLLMLHPYSARITVTLRIVWSESRILATCIKFKEIVETAENRDASHLLEIKNFR